MTLTYVLGLVASTLSMGEARLPAAEPACEVRRSAAVGTLLELWTQCPNRRPEIEDAIRDRGQEIVPQLIDAFRSRPDLRRGVVSSLGHMGEVGLTGLGLLGSEALYVLARAGPPDDDVVATLHGLGRPALDTLFAMLRDPDRDVRIFAVSSLRQWGPEAMDGLLEAMDANPDPDVRRLSAQAAAHIDSHRALPRLLLRLKDRSLTGTERKAVASLLVTIDDPAALDALVRVLKDASVERWVRWDLAEQMKQSGRPDVAAAAKKYGPTGRQGEGNPESPLGNILALACLVAVVAVFVRYKGQLTTGERMRLLVGGTISVYVAATVALPVSGLIGLGLGARPLWLTLAYAAALWAGSALGVAMIKGPRLPRACAPVVATGALLGFLAGFTLDRAVNWYLDRISSRILGFYESPLVLGITLAGALAASYLFRVPAGQQLETGRRIKER